MASIFNNDEKSLLMKSKRGNKQFQRCSSHLILHKFIVELRNYAGYNVYRMNESNKPNRAGKCKYMIIIITQ